MTDFPDQDADQFEEPHPDTVSVENIGEQDSIPETTGIAWGFVAVLLLAILVAIFIVQNDEPMAVEFLWFDFQMSIWVVILAVVLITMIADQVISLFYRRRKRRNLAERSRPD